MKLGIVFCVVFSAVILAGCTSSLSMDTDVSIQKPSVSIDAPQGTSTEESAPELDELFVDDMSSVEIGEMI